MKKDVFSNFTNFTGTHLCKSLLFNKFTGLRPATLLQKGLWHRRFPLNLLKFLRTPFLTEHFWTTASAEIAMAVETMKITTSQLILLKVLSNSVTDNISIASTTTSSTSCIRERIEGQNLDDALSVDQGAKRLRLKIDRKKLEQLLSVGFLVRKTAEYGLPGPKLHHSL